MLLPKDLLPSSLNITSFFSLGEKQESKTKPSKQVEFQLPIQYLEKSDIHILHENVSNDLEFSSIYSYFTNPSTLVSQQIIPQLSKYYTHNIDFLKETQALIQEHGPQIKCSPPIDYNKTMTIWKEIKEDDFFLEKYSYIEWPSLMYLNESATFLQCLSMANIISPLITFILPVLFLLFPFVLLKLQGIPITFEVYMDILKEISKHHFIGKLFSIESFSIERISYLAISAMFYFFQIYQNITSFMHFYENTKKINESLIDIRNYTVYSIESIENFLLLHQKKTYYQSFCRDMEAHLHVLKKINKELTLIQPFSHSVAKINEIGYMLKCFYDLHCIEEYNDTIQWVFSFDGYIQTIRGIYENMEQKHIHLIEFNTDASSSSSGNTIFINQYYPPLIGKNPVKNTSNMEKNIIITGPNASGKTTFLKTTVLNILFSQQFGCGFYDEKSILNPYSHIHSYINIPDTSQRDSLFQAESRRCKEILDSISHSDENERHFCIFDELYSGTNPTEATKSGFSFLNYLAKNNSVNFILTTHYIDICDRLEDHENIENYMMKVEETDDGKIHYTYEMEQGISRYEGAIHVFKEMNYPQDIIDDFIEFSDNENI
jgi:hypothetical protein